jgi:hypothetical protein
MTTRNELIEDYAKIIDDLRDRIKASTELTKCYWPGNPEFCRPDNPRPCAMCQIRRALLGEK